MARKITPIEEPDEKDTEAVILPEQELEERVDEMMDIERSEKPVKAAKKITVIDHQDDTSPDDDNDDAGLSDVEQTEPESLGVDNDNDDTKQSAPAHSELDETIAALNEQLQQDKPGPPPVEDDSDDSDEPEPVENDISGETPKKTGSEAVSSEESEVVETEEPEDTVEPGVTSLDDTINSPETNWAVDDILAKESDELLQKEDAKIASLQPAKPKRRGLRGIIAAWWHSKVARRITLGVLALLIAGAALLPVTRYWALNLFGVRSSASVRITDASTFQPLQNVKVTIAGQSAQTDIDGNVTLTGLRLGPTQLIVEKRAFAPIHKSMTVGWGSNPLGDFEITPVGTQYGFEVKDFLSGEPIQKAQATAGDANALSDENGVIKLTLDHADAAKDVEVVITAEGYRTERRTIGPDNRQDTALQLVAEQKSVFVSKRSGTYDVYAIYADGSEETKLLPGTGNEQSNLVLTPSPDGRMAALVSTRDNERNDDGFLKSTLTVISVSDGASKTVTHSEQITLVGWIGPRLIYVQVAAGTSAANPSRSRLMSYDFNTNSNQQLAATNYFNSILIAGKRVYYAPSSTYQAAGVAINLFSIEPDGSNKRTILAQETWSVFRVAYDTLSISVADQSWYGYKIGDETTTSTDGPPGDLVSRRYADSPDGARSLWVDNRDGKGTLLVYDVGQKTDKEVYAVSGLQLPVRWLNNSTVVYRVSTDQETADYAISINGGEPRKIVNVTNTGDIDRWYYY